MIRCRNGKYRNPRGPGARPKGVRSVIYLALLLSLGACGPGHDGTPGATGVRPAAEASTATMTAGQPTAVANSPRPPPVVVRGGGREISLVPWSYCWSGDAVSVCASGQPPESPPDVGNPGEIEITFPVPGFGFTATAHRHGETCGRAQTVTLESTGPSTHRLLPVGQAGDYVVRLLGRSGEGVMPKGDVSASFRWHTPRDGPNEAPTAAASILAGSPTDLRSFGVSLEVHDLRATPGDGRATATAVVTSHEGASMRIELERRERRSEECVDEGSVFFDAAEALGEQATRLGSAPFRYDITLVIDSIAYHGTATWPDDVEPACSPCTPLRFNPPLPGL